MMSFFDLKSIWCHPGISYALAAGAVWSSTLSTYLISFSFGLAGWWALYTYFPFPPFCDAISPEVCTVLTEFHLLPSSHAYKLPRNSTQPQIMIIDPSPSDYKARKLVFISENYHHVDINGNTLSETNGGSGSSFPFSFSLIRFLCFRPVLGCAIYYAPSLDRYYLLQCYLYPKRMSNRFRAYMNRNRILPSVIEICWWFCLTRPKLRRSAKSWSGEFSIACGCSNRFRLN